MSRFLGHLDDDPLYNPRRGTALVWFPATVYLAVTGHVVRARALVVFCAAVGGSVDNALRPRLVGRTLKMHDLLVLLATLGGLFMFSLLGFIVGPIVAALFIIIWEIYAVMARGEAPSVDPESEPGGGSDRA